MNTWDYHPIAIVEADDFQDRYDRNGLNYLFYWKSKFPEFKITLFAIPERTSDVMLNLVYKNKDWIELAVHGWNHESNFECYSWDYDKTMAILERVEKKQAYVNIFKAPGWSITPGFNGYPADESLPLSKDPTAVYRALQDKGYAVVDRHYNTSVVTGNIICIDDNPNFVHMHTWNMETGDKNSRNGFGQVEEIHGVPWDNKTQFFFITEALEKGMIESCKK